MIMRREHPDTIELHRSGVLEWLDAAEGLMALHRSCIGIGRTFNEDAVSFTIDNLGWVNQNQIERTN